MTPIDGAPAPQGKADSEKASDVPSKYRDNDKLILELKEDVEDTDERMDYHSDEASNALIGVAKPKPPIMMSESKKRKLRRSQEKVRKQAAKEREAARRDPGHSQMVDVHEDDDSRSEESHVETYEQKKKRVNIEDYHALRKLPKTERRDKIMDKHKEMLDYDSDEDCWEKVRFNFLNKVNREEEYPISSIQKLIIMNVKDQENKNKNTFTDSKMIHMYAQAPLINGLCLL